MDAQDRIPLEAIHDNGGLWVPKKLSRETANRLEKRRWIAVQDVDECRYFVALTDAGRRALAAALNPA